MLKHKTMKKLITLILSIVLIALLSCEKTNNTNDDIVTTITQDSIKAGVYDTSFIHFTFPTPISLTVLWDSMNLYGHGKDSVQLNLGVETISLTFEINLLNNDSIHLLLGDDPYPLPSLYLYWPDDFGVALDVEYVYVGQGKIVSNYSIDRIPFSEIIKPNDNWCPPVYKNFHKFKMWEVPPKHASDFSSGPWHYCPNPRMYIGFSYKGKLGWIRVDASDKENTKIISYAIRK